jgi:hypothetical protein
MEKSLYKMCTSLNVKFSNEAVSATKEHINTLLENQKQVHAVFGIYRLKLLATQKTMNKNSLADQSYEDVSVIFTDKQINTKETVIPAEVLEFWGTDLSKEDILFLEREYTKFKQTHVSSSYTETTLFQQICFTLLDIKKARANADNTDKLMKTLQDLMGNLNITPKTANANNTNSESDEAFGLWILDIEKEEPAQWLKTDPRGDMYRDVANVEQYYKDFVVRPLKNLIQGSKDFNVDDAEVIMNEYDEATDLPLSDLLPDEE